MSRGTLAPIGFEHEFNSVEVQRTTSQGSRDANRFLRPGREELEFNLSADGKV